MLNKILPIILILSALVNAQNEYKPWIKGERERYSKQIQLSKVMYPGDSKIDVTYYGLDLSITANPNYLTGNVIIGVKADTTSLNTCFLDLRNFLIVDSLLLNGTAAVYDHSNNKINITLDHTYSQGEPFTLRVYYHGVPGSSGFGGFLFGTHSGTPVISTLSESYSGPYWWPQKDTPADKADSSEVWITVANNLTPVSNGILEGIVDNGNGTHTYHWKEKYAIAAYLISLAISNYTQYDTYYHYSPTDSMVITHFIYPENFNYVKPYADATAGMIEVFSNRFGQYPFLEERYGHAEFSWGGSMEHQTCTSMGFWGTGVVSHELAHQWYGDMITCKDWHHIWLNEGFATYAEAVYLEAINGQSAYNSQIQSEMNSARGAVGTIWVQDITNENQIFNGARSYAKGACVLHMLRGIVGDSTIFDILRAYSDDPDLKYNAATTEDFQAVAESVSGQDLDYFFQEWIYGENYPKYSIVWGSQPIGSNQYQANVNITQNINTNPAFFTMPIQIKFNYASGDTTVTVFNNQQSQYFQIVLNNNPQSINFDPGNWILKTVLSITTPVELTVFTAVVDGRNVKLHWTTSTEINNRGFEVQKKSTEDFYTITFVEGAGTTSETHNYSFIDKNLDPGIYTYRLKQFDFDGGYQFSEEIKVDISAPSDYELSQNYPNPFNPSTKISYSLPQKEKVSMKVYDVLGNEVAVLINNKEMEAGNYEIDFNAAGLKTGVYFYRIESGSFVETKKLMLLR